MKQVIAISRQEAELDVVSVQTHGFDSADFIRTVYPLAQRAGAQLRPSLTGLHLTIKSGQGKAFLQSLDMLLGLRGIPLRCTA